MKKKQVLNSYRFETHRDQPVLFPSTIDKYVERENPVRFIDAFVDSLNLEKLGFKHSILADTGRLYFAT